MGATRGVERAGFGEQDVGPRHAERAARRVVGRELREGFGEAGGAYTTLSVLQEVFLGAILA